MDSHPTRQVIRGDALAWLAVNPATPLTSLVASLPDVTEVGASEARWRELFADAVTLSLNAIPPRGVAVFFQTDLKREGRWVSKAGMVLAAADRAGVPLLWHKLVCRQAPGRIQHGRPAYSHLLAFSREARDDSRVASPDVLPMHDAGLDARAVLQGPEADALLQGAHATADRAWQAPACQMA